MNLFDCNWKVAAQAIQEMEAVVICFGSVEEHGYHLPMGTDTILASHIIKDLDMRFPICYYPCVSFGQVYSAEDYEGTVSIPFQTLLAYGKDIVRSVLKAKPKRILLYSFHNGNLECLKHIQRELYDESRNIFVLSYPNLDKDVQDILTSEIACGIWHAGELESSLMLYVAEDLVDLKQAIPEFPHLEKADSFRSMKWREYNPSGAFGDPRVATKEKGELMYHRLIQKLSEDVEAILKGKVYE